MSSTLVITNDFPPRAGGIQSYVQGFVDGFDPESVVVFASSSEGHEAFDAAQSYPVHRYRSGLMIPTPDVAKRACEIAREYECDSVWFGAMAPLGVLAKTLKRKTKISWAVASTHGHEVGWAALPGARQSLRTIAKSVDVVTYLGDYTRTRLEPIIGELTRLERLPGGVDIERFNPQVDASHLRAQLGLHGRNVIVCVSRLTQRKGQDVLIKALPRIRTQVPDAALLIVGSGPYESKLKSLVSNLGLDADVVFTGAVAGEQLAEYYLCGDVFAMPCRTRRAGLDVEGLGLVFLEASAVGLPVVAGDSGGAPDAVIQGVTGQVVDGRDVSEVAATLTGMLKDSAGSRGMGSAGRAWVEREWRWEVLSARLKAMLSG